MSALLVVGRRSQGRLSAQLSAALWRRWPKTRLQAVVTLALLAVLAFAIVRFVGWAFTGSVWHAASAAECAKLGSGACWAVLPARFRLILFGVYPFEEQWRAALGCVVLLAGCVLSCAPIFWRFGRLAMLWLGSFLTFLILLHGGLFGLTIVTTDNWGGLALTFLIFASVMVFGLPCATLLALARSSRSAWLRHAAGGFVDLVRAVPLIAVLFGAALVVPLIVPAWLAGDKLTRVIIGSALFFSAYQAEIIRGGLQSIPPGQREAANALGLRYWQYQYLVILPQVFRTILPQTINQAVAGFKDTSYVAIVGFFDMTASASAAMGTGDWALAFVEVYFIVGAIYLVFGYSLSRYGAYLERRLGAAYLR